MIRALVVALMVLLAAPAVAQEVKVSADSFVVDQSGSIATFTGNVLVTRVGLEVKADKVLVKYGAGGVEDIESFEATGNVRITTEGQTAVGNRAVFDPNTQILTMTGDVAVEGEQGRLQGPLLTVDLKTNKSTFSGGNGGRVTGVFTPE